MKKICVIFTKNLLKFCTSFFQKILEMFHNLIKFTYLLKTIFKNFDKFLRFIKLQGGGNF